MLKRTVVLVGVLCAGGGVFAGLAFSIARIDPANHDAKIVAALPKKLMAQYSVDEVTVTSTSFTNLTVDTITIPPKGKFRLVVRFSGESSCSDRCLVRVMVDGVEANPKAGADFAFDSGGGEVWQSLAFERISDQITGTGSARNVNVAVDAAVLDGSWRIDDWLVTAELWKV
ncbi:MAG TPA: hypothetical protein VJT84_14590 [Gaiellaceae bacterium]|nr:hypothetical protein [Gaiellaceae bacterium]